MKNRRAMKNQVIEVLNKEHGKRVIEYWRKQGIPTYLEGTNTLETPGWNMGFRFYGVIDEKFGCYSQTCLTNYDVEIITLPEEWIPVRGERVLVKSDGLDWMERTYICNIEGADSPYVTVYIGDEYKYSLGKPFDVTLFREIKQLPKVEEMTLEQVCKELGREVKIVK